MKNKTHIKARAKVRNRKSQVKMVAPKEEIIALCLEDHKPLKEWIKTLKNPDVKITKKRPIFEKFAEYLGMHAKSEEKSLYVEMKTEKDLCVESFEGDTEHEIADRLVGEVKETENSDEWMAKVKVLAELVEHHIEEEEEEIFKEVKKKFDLETRVEIGREYLRLRASFSPNDGLDGRSKSLFTQLLAS